MNEKKENSSVETNNVFKPMPAASDSSSSKLRRDHTLAILVTLVALVSASAVLLYQTGELSILNIALQLVPGIIIFLFTVFLPAGAHLTWRKKYWLGFRILLLIVSLILMMPITIAFDHLNNIIFLAGLTIAGAYFAERTIRRRS